MYKIMYLKTGHIFILPQNSAEELKEKFPDEYKILEKNGKKFNDEMPQKRVVDTKSVYDLVVEQ